MKKETERKVNNQSGAAMLISVIFFLFISLAIIAGLVGEAVREFKNTSVNLNSKKAYFLAESGTEDALYRISKSMAIGSSETLTLNNNSAATTITTLLGNVKQIISLGDVSSYQRKASLKISAGDGAVFKYGTEAGQGGLIFHNNSHLNGNLYSDGNIIGSNGAYITGDAYVAGNSGLISNMRVGYGGTGDVHAHNVTGSTVTGAIYCQTGSSNNKPCDPSQTDPVSVDFPISDDLITKWKNDATSGGTTSGSVTISSPTTIGPRKITGDLTINSTLTIADTIYVAGNVIINGAVKLDASYGATSGMIIADGYITIGNGVIFQDSGTAGSYILLLSNSTCDGTTFTNPCNGNYAISVSNNSNISIVNAEKGTVYFSNNASVKEVVGDTIELKNNVGITYGSGLINVGFTSGPSGGWIISDWKESQ